MSEQLDGELKHWQICDMPECSTEVPTAIAICRECAGVDNAE